MQNKGSSVDEILMFSLDQLRSTPRVRYESN